MENKKRVYLKGNAFATYRSRVLLEYLLASPKYTISYIDPRYLSTWKTTLLNRLFFKALRIIDRFYNLGKLCISDIVYILPMSSLDKSEVFLINLFKKYVIGEFYISMYDTLVNDRKAVDSDSKKAQQLLEQDQRFVDVCNQIIFLNISERTYYLNLIARQDIIDKTALIPLATSSKKRATLPYINHNSQTLVLCWWGTFIPLHGLEKIVESAKFIKAAAINFKLYLFGTSEAKSLPYKKQIADLGLENFVFIDNSKNFADKSLEHFLVEQCDIAFGNFGDSEKARTVMVNKVVESASMGIPVVSQETTALSEYFIDGESIAFCEASPQSIANKVIDLSNDIIQMNRIGSSAFTLYTSRFSKEAYIADIMQILKKVQ